MRVHRVAHSKFGSQRSNGLGGNGKRIYRNVKYKTILSCGKEETLRTSTGMRRHKYMIIGIYEIRGLIESKVKVK